VPVSTNGVRAALSIAVVGLLAFGTDARADEGGSSFWLPGQMGSFAAVPSETGWSLPLLYVHTSSSADVNKTFQIGGRLALGLDAKADLLMAVPTYVFTTPVAGGQAAVSLTGLVGDVRVDTYATLTGPRGNSFSRGNSDSRTGFGDLYPMASLKWNDGVHNFMTYTMAGVPVGSYDADRLANLGLNHWALDVGGGYTYLDAAAGHEFSAVLGFTYNWQNPDTQYQSGTSGHLDLAASQFVSEQWHVGLVGYWYKQVTADSGAGAVLGDFKSQVGGIGPQAGYFFKVAGREWYLNLKGFYEFDAKYRPEGWNLWVTLGIPLGSAPK